MAGDKFEGHKMSEHMKKCVKYTKTDIKFALIGILEGHNIEYELLEGDAGIRCINIGKQDIKNILKENSELEYSIIKTFCNIIKVNNCTGIVFSDLSN